MISEYWADYDEGTFTSEHVVISVTKDNAVNFINRLSHRGYQVTNVRYSDGVYFLITADKKEEVNNKVAVAETIEMLDIDGWK